MRFEFKTKKETYLIEGGFSIKKRDYILGISSQCRELHVGFFDLDDMNMNNARLFIERLQSKYHLSHALLINGGRDLSHHAVFFELRPFSFWVKLNLFNKAFCSRSVFRGEFVLRLSAKNNKNLRAVGVVVSKYKAKKVSSEHLMIYKKVLKLIPNYDNNTKFIKNPCGVQINLYKTLVEL